MKASPLLVSWHNENAPIYSTHFEPSGKGRLATSGGDNNVRLWKVVGDGEDRQVTYLTTLVKHTQAVNVVRFAPRGEVLATAGDDGNILLWIPSEIQNPQASSFGEDGLEDKETWRVKHMCRSFGSEIYDLAWAPDAVFFITGSMDNIARIYNAQTGQMVRQIAEHNHYVQGVAWDPLNEYVATQSSDRSVHIYNLRNKDGEFTLRQHNKVTKMDIPARRISASSPAPPEIPSKQSSMLSENAAIAPASPAPSASIPGTPTSLALPMNPPVISHSRRSSFGSSPSLRRSASPAPSMPLPAVRPMENSPNPYSALSFKNATIYANETCTSFFRRLTFAPDGSLLFTPAGQYKTPLPPAPDGTKQPDDLTNTVYIYTRAGLNKPPIAHLPGHKKSSVAVKCSPIFYTLRQTTPKKSVQITLDTSSADEAISALPDPIMPNPGAPSASPSSSMNPPPVDRSSVTMPSPKDAGKSTFSPRGPESGSAGESAGPAPAFALPYRIVYAVATQDAVLVYDTQQQTPICVVSNLHFATFTDLAWSNDGLTLIMSSSDGFCSSLAFAPNELGQVYTGQVPTLHHPHPHSIPSSLSIGIANSAQASPVPTPTSSTAPTLSRLPGPPSIPPSLASPTSNLTGGIAPPPLTGYASSPTKSRSNSTSSVATQASHAPTPILGTVPGVTATNSGQVVPPLPLSTPPMTPMSNASAASSMHNGAIGGGGGTGSSAGVLGKRDGTKVNDGEGEDRQAKKRRIAPTPVTAPSVSAATTEPTAAGNGDGGHEGSS